MSSTKTPDTKVKDKSEQMARVINPATEEILGEYPWLSDDELEQALEKSENAFEMWRRESLEQRCTLLRQVSQVLRDRQDLLARQMTLEMGKPIEQSASEVEKCAWVCEHYAREAPSYLAPEEHESDGKESFVRFDPLGIVLAVMPWNFPLWQVFRFAAPTLAAGNTALLKHATNVAGCAVAIEEVFHEAGFADGVFTNLNISRDQTSRVIEWRSVQAVSLTGSEGAGKAIAQNAGKQIKKCVLELGGSDPFIVLADADLDHVIPGAVQGRTQNTGQSCIAAKRFIVVDSLLDEFEKRLVKRFQELKMGDPLDPQTQLGPMARDDLREELHEQVERTVEAGAELRCGGKLPEGAGYFYPATVLANVNPGMPAFDEETFGPVAAVTRAKDADHAVELANQSRFGLGASIWTQDESRAKLLAERLDVGGVFINSIVKSDPRLPFGGVGKSGYGRELARYGIREFVNAKTVYVGKGD